MEIWLLSADAYHFHFCVNFPEVIMSYFYIFNFICRLCHEQSRWVPFQAVLGVFSLVVRVVMWQMVVHALALKMKLVCLEEKMKFYLQRNRPPYHPKLAAGLRMLINLVVFSKLNDAHFMSIR